jgi:hypothetical protein
MSKIKNMRRLRATRKKAFFFYLDQYTSPYKQFKLGNDLFERYLDDGRHKWEFYRALLKVYAFYKPDPFELDVEDLVSAMINFGHKEDYERLRHFWSCNPVYIRDQGQKWFTLCHHDEIGLKMTKFFIEQGLEWRRSAVEPGTLVAKIYQEQYQEFHRQNEAIIQALKLGRDVGRLIALNVRYLEVLDEKPVSTRTDWNAPITVPSMPLVILYNELARTDCYMGRRFNWGDAFCYRQHRAEFLSLCRNLLKK